MFAYDNFYDYLFNDQAFLEILYKFHSSSWANLSTKEKQGVINDFVKRYCEIFKIDDIKTRKLDDGARYSGVYSDLRPMVHVSKEGIESESQYDVMDTLFHELRHNFQHRAISNNLSDMEQISEKQIRNWKANFLSSPSGLSNYINSSCDNSELYIYQPVETDAFKTGLSCTKKAYGLIEKKLGYDNQFVIYSRKNASQIMILFSDEKLYADYRKEYEKKVFDYFASNNKKFEIEQKCLKIAKEIMKKDLKEMSFEEVNSLLSVYVWCYLDDDYKIDVLKEYDRRVCPNNHFKIKKSGNSAFEMYGVLYPREDILSILNGAFSAEYKLKVKNIIEGKESCNEALKNELMLNMYRHEGKLINFVEDSENFLLYSIQPFSLLEGKVIMEQFKKVKESEKQIYDVDGDDYEGMIDFYDYSKYIPYIEKFYGKSFKTIYNDQLKEMKKRIAMLPKKEKKV